MRTNYVVFGLRERSDRRPLEVRAEVLAELERRGVLCIPYSQGRIRALTHAGIGSEDVDRVLDAMRGALRNVGLAPLAA